MKRTGETPNFGDPSQLAKRHFRNLLAPPILGIGLSLAVTRVCRLLSDRFVSDKAFYLSNTYVNGEDRPKCSDE